VFLSMNHVRIVSAFVAALLGSVAATHAQTTYHLHNEASTTSGLKQLKTGAPDVASVALLTSNLKSTSNGEKLIEDFDTQAGVPGVAGVIPTGSTVTFQMWMRKTANVGTLFPRGKLLLNSAAGTSLCVATGTTAITTTLTKYTISCTTTANVTLTASSRFFVWAGANMTAGSTTTNFMAELDLEGTLNGNFDTQVSIPNPVPVPSVSGIAPAPAGIGQSVTVTGTNFGATQGASTLKFFNNKTAVPTAWSATSITAPVPTGAATGNVTVTVGGQTSTGVSFTVMGAPNISSLSPTSGPVGLSITVNGTNFGATQSGSTVKFNGTLATPTNWTTTAITVPVPAGATTGGVVVRVGTVDSNARTFTVLPSPSISSLSLTSGLPGTSVTITGTNFGATKGSSTVKFNGMTAATTSWSSTNIGATVPAGATTGNVVVTVSSVASNGVLFTVPTLSSISLVPGDLTIPITSKQQYKALGTYSDSSVFDVTATATWSSVDTSVLSTAAGGMTTTAAKGQTQLQATIGAIVGTANVTVSDSRFASLSPLTVGRLAHTATPLPNGKVLIAGGQDGGTVLDSAELYDPATGRFSATGSMSFARTDHSATLLQNGQVLIVGGIHFEPDVESLSSAELYDPASGTFTFVGYANSHQFFHSAALLNDGRVLITGGHYLEPGGGGASPPELFDPSTSTFALAGANVVIRSTPTSTTLLDGSVLVVGGSDIAGPEAATSEIYDPVADTFTPTASPIVPRAFHTATRLNDGRVLIAGTSGLCSGGPCPAEIFDPVTHTFSLAGRPSVARAFHAAVLLGDGTVLVSGGQVDGVDTATAEVFDPATSTFTAAGSMAGFRGAHTATILNDGTALIAGGSGPFAPRGAELYSPAPLAPLSLSVTPASATMQPGESRSFTAIDHLGHVRVDASWSVDNPTVGTVDPVTGLVSATATGNLVVTASIGAVDATAQIVVAPAGQLSMGTVRWSSGAPAGGATTRMVAGYGTGPAFFSVNSSASDTQIQGLTPDGQQVWSTWLQGTPQSVVANGSGGLLLTYFNGCDNTNPIRLVNIDGPTGMWAWEAVGASLCPSEIPEIAFRHDGSVAVVTPGNLSGFPGLMLLDGVTGQPQWAPAIPQSTFTSVNGQQTPGYSRIGPAIVDIDGTVHMLFEKRVLAYPPQVVNTGIWLMSVNTDQTFTTTQLSATTSNTNLFPGRIVPDGNDGLVATWIDSPIVPLGQPPAQSTFRAAHVTSGGGISLFDLPLTPPQELLLQPNSGLPVNPELTLGENGMAYVTYAAGIASFNVNSGALGWSHTEANSVDLLAAQADGSVVARTASGGADSILQIGLNGAVTLSSLGVANVSHVVGDLWTSGGSNGANAVEGLKVDWARTGWFQPAQAGQRRVQGTYRDRPGVTGYQDAAFDMMRTLRPRVGPIEWGGLICKFADVYKWAKLVPGTISSVSPLTDPDSLAFCSSGTISSVVHMHRLEIDGYPGPSGGDIANANGPSNTGYVYFLSAPTIDRKPGVSQFYRYKGPNAAANTCLWVGSVWMKYVAPNWVTCGAP
jgi:hypothetical protein